MNNKKHAYSIPLVVLDDDVISRRTEVLTKKKIDITAIVKNRYFLVFLFIVLYIKESVPRVGIK